MVGRDCTPLGSGERSFWRICGALPMSAAMEIERYHMNGAGDAADVEPQPTPSVGQAPRGAGEYGGPQHDVNMSDLPSEGGPLPTHGQASGWHPNGTRMPHAHVFFDTSMILTTGGLGPPRP